MPTTSAPTHATDATGATDARVARGERLRQLHEGPGAFVVPNPWDPGSARLLEQLGFDALATTGAGIAFSLGRRDGSVGRDGLIAHIGAIAASTTLPVTADLEGGFGDDPAQAAATITAAAEAGVVGGSIEDRAYDGRAGLFDRALAVERIAAAAEAARSLPFPFTLTARCESYLVGEPDLDEVIARLQAYAEAGADVVYAPGANGRDEIAAIVGAVDRPVNVVVGLVGEAIPVAELAELGVRRISLGSTLARLAYGTLVDAAREIANDGTFTLSAAAMPYADINTLMVDS
ncbi:MAG: isocitrate lyase/phosphoenolpyruvate mutase family protein [Actinomycetota bacterium]|nr:isocitrate lyase/phosphoenolpyruvate mutase family protein [Actinomycetota bacterium]